MPLDRVISPITRDYVDDGAGGYVETATIQTAVYHQLTGHMNQWPGDPDAGSLFYTLQREKDTISTRQRAAGYVEEALARFIRSGRAADLEVTIEHDDVGRLVVRSELRDVQYATPEPLSFPLVPGGI